MDSLSSKVKHGIKWQAIISVISQVVYFVNGVILARILGPKEFGVYGMAQIVSSFVWMFWQLGLNAAIIQRKEIDEAHLNTGFTLSFGMGIVAFFITWSSAPFVASFFKESEVVFLVRVIAFTFIIYSLDRVPSALLSRELRFKEAAIPGLINAFLYPLVAIPLALMGFGAKSFVWGVLAGAVAMLIIRYYWLFKYFSWRPRFGFDMKSVKDLLGFGIFLTLKSVLDFVFVNLQRILVGRRLDSTMLGFYNRAGNLSYLPLAKITSFFAPVLLPTFSKIQDNPEKTRDWFRKFVFLTYLAITPLLMFFVFFPDLLIRAIFGVKWLFSAKLLVWTSLSALISAPMMYWQTLLNSRGRSDVLFYIRLLQLPAFLFVVFFSLRYGVVGLVVGLFLYRLVCEVPIMIYFVRRMVGVGLRDFIVSVFEPVLIFLAISFIAFPLKGIGLSLYPKFILISAMYGLMTIAYYSYRYLLSSRISYLGFDLRELLKHR